jgi:hypothetical protein
MRNSVAFAVVLDQRESSPWQIVEGFFDLANMLVARATEAEETKPFVPEDCTFMPSFVDQVGQGKVRWSRAMQFENIGVGPRDLSATCLAGFSAIEAGSWFSWLPSSHSYQGALPSGRVSLRDQRECLFSRPLERLISFL